MTGLTGKMDLEGREGPWSLMCWNQNFYVGNPMLMKTQSLAGGWCWNPFSTVPRISHTFTLFVLLSLHFLRWPCRKTPSDGADYTLYPAWQFLPSFFFHPFFFSSAAHSHLSVSTSNSWSVTNVQRLQQFVSNFLVIVSFLHSLFTLGFAFEKYILGWLIPQRLISAAGWWLPAALCSVFVWRAIFENKFVGGINQTFNAALARRTVSLLTWWPSVCVSVRMPVSGCLAKLSDDVFTPQSSPFANLLIKYPQMPAQHIAHLNMHHIYFTVLAFVVCFLIILIIFHEVLSTL